MKNESKSTSRRKPQTKEDVLNSLVPKRVIEATANKLRVFKEKPNPKTRGVTSTKFGFTQKLTIFVLPELTDAEIIEKFKSRLKSEPVSTFRKTKAV